MRGKYEIGFVNRRLYCYNCATITFLLGTHCINTGFGELWIKTGMCMVQCVLRLDSSCMCSGMYTNCYEFGVGIAVLIYSGQFTNDSWP